MTAFDVLIRGGQVIDGRGTPPRPCDVAVSGGRVAAVDVIGSAWADRVIDATGLVVAPGFIDTHVHSDAMLLAEPGNVAKLMQGVTTEVLGQDGQSYAPLGPRNLGHMRRYLAAAHGDPEIGWDWSSVAEYRARFDNRVAVNTVYLVPHSTVRLEVIGPWDRPLQGDDLARAQALIAEGLADGAVGLSSGLSYFPGSYADTNELIECCRPLAARGGVYVTHIRTVFRTDRYDPLLEAIQIGRMAGVPVHVSHLRTDVRSAGRVDQLLEPIEHARAEGLDISLDIYPYPSGSGCAHSLLPAWVHEGYVEDILARLADPHASARLIADMRTASATTPVVGQVGAVERRISWVRTDRNKDLVGLTFSAGARRRGFGDDVDRFLVELLLEEELAVGMVNLPPDEETWSLMDRDLLMLFAQPYVMLGSDSIPVGDACHPRLFGAFPRLLGRLRRRSDLSLETLVNRLTCVPARRFGLADRGQLLAGMAADIVVFDADALMDNATYENPRRLPTGVRYVLVNGQIAVDDGVPTEVLAGRALP